MRRLRAGFPAQNLVALLPTVASSLWRRYISTLCQSRSTKSSINSLRASFTTRS